MSSSNCGWGCKTSTILRAHGRQEDSSPASLWRRDEMSVDWKPHWRLRGRARPVVGTEQQDRWVSRVSGRRQKQLIEIIRGVIRQNVARSKVSGNNQDCVDTHGWLDPCPSCREWVLLLTGALIPARPSASCDAPEAACANGRGCPEYDHSSCRAPRDGTRMQDSAKMAVCVGTKLLTA